MYSSRLKVHSIASLYGQSLSTRVSELKFDRAAVEPTAFRTGTTLNYLNIHSGEICWDVASHDLPGLNKNSEKKSMKCKIR